MNLRDILNYIGWKSKPKTQAHHGIPDFRKDEDNPFDITEDDVNSLPEESGSEHVIFVPSFVSTNVLAIWYLPASENLFVQFDNHREKAGPRVYRYPNVPYHEFELLRDAASKGKFIWGAYRWPGYPFDRFGSSPPTRDETAKVYGEQKKLKFEGDDFLSMGGVRSPG